MEQETLNEILNTQQNTEEKSERTEDLEKVKEVFFGGLDAIVSRFQTDREKE